MKSNEFTTVKWKFPGIADIKAIVFQSGDEIILFFIELKRQIEKEAIPLCFDTSIIFGNVQVVKSKDIRALCCRLKSPE